MLECGKNIVFGNGLVTGAQSDFRAVLTGIPVTWTLLQPALAHGALLSCAPVKPLDLLDRAPAPGPGGI